MKHKCGSYRKSLLACLQAQMNAWFHSPRTIIMGIVLLCFAYMNAQSYIQMITQRGYTVHLGETVFYFLNTGFSMVMTSTFLLIMVSEMPKQMSFQNFMLIRVKRHKWLISQILFCLTVAILMLILVTIFSVTLTIPYLELGTGWSDLERLAENPDYKYEVQLVKEYVRVLPPWRASIYAGTIVLSFWVTMLLVILTFSLFGYPNIGLLLYMFILQFALTFRFEVIYNMRTPIHYATMQAVANQFAGKEIESIPQVVLCYLIIDCVLVMIMSLRIRNADLHFNG